MRKVATFKIEDKLQRQAVDSTDLKIIELKSVIDRLADFPATRYYGSKRKLLPWIFDSLKSLPFETVLDGFGGTASVSLLFKAMGKHVTYLDAFSFNRNLAHAVLADRIAIDRNDFIKFVEEIVPIKGFITKTFNGMYYKASENKWLDGFMQKLFKAKFSDAERAVFFYSLFQACLMKRPFNLFHRANLDLRLNKDVERKFGNLATWEKSFQELMLRSYDELLGSIWEGRGSVIISQAKNVEKTNKIYDLVYFDPPYVSNTSKNNNDHYFRRYHFLEGLTKYDDWKKLIDPSSLLKEMLTPTVFKEWNSKKTFQQKLFSLIKKHNKSIVVLSYITDAYPSFDVIEGFFEENFSEVTVHIKEHNHALAKQRKKELLFIGRPK